MDAPVFLLRLKYWLRDFAARNFFCNLIAEIFIYVVWGAPMYVGFLPFAGSEWLAIGFLGLSSILGIWLFAGLDERRLKDIPEDMLRLEWTQLN